MMPKQLCQPLNNYMTFLPFSTLAMQYLFFSNMIYEYIYCKQLLHFDKDLKTGTEKRWQNLYHNR